MAFPKPQKRTSETNAFYERKYEQFAAQTALRIGVQKISDIAPIQIVDRLIARRAHLSKKTWQVYKSALLAHFDQAATACGDFYRQLEYTYAVGVLSQETQTEAMTRGTRTSALKSRRISEKDHQQLLDYLQGRKGKDKWAAFTQTWCQAARLTGLRPGEWAKAYIDQLPSGERALVVANAKCTQGRGNGATRHLVLTGLSAEQFGYIEDMGEIARHYETTEETMEDLQSWVSKYLYRASRAALGKRKHYPCLYTFRHQFAADAKRWLPAPEAAALMGHYSDQTAARNYARAMVSTRPVTIKPLASEVANVRRVARQRPAVRDGKFPPMKR